MDARTGRKNQQCGAGVCDAGGIVKNDPARVAVGDRLVDANKITGGCGVRYWPNHGHNQRQRSQDRGTEYIHVSERPVELARVGAAEGELAVGFPEARRRGERDTNLVSGNQALLECVVRHRRDARILVGEQ